MSKLVDTYNVIPMPWLESWYLSPSKHDNIILLKDDPSFGVVLQVRGDDGGVVPGYIRTI